MSVIARTAAEARYPELWAGLFRWWMPHEIIPTPTAGLRNRAFNSPIIGANAGIAAVDLAAATLGDVVGWAHVFGGSPNDFYSDTGPRPNWPVEGRSNGFSGAAWLKWTGGATSYGTIIDRLATGAADTLYWYSGNYSGVKAVHLVIGGTTMTSKSLSFHTTDVWAHCAWTWDGATVRYYFQGIPDGTDSHTDTLGNPGTPFATGVGAGVSGSGTERWTGHMADLGFWSRVLSHQEVQLLARGASPLTPKLDHAYLVPAAPPAGEPRQLTLLGVGAGA